MIKVVVASGKGGVGKTTIALAMARTLAERYKVGLFDADVTGANTHLQLEILRDMEVKDRVKPAIAELDGKRIEYLSISLISDSYVKWKGDSVGDFITQLMDKTDWTCDYLIIDAPPGTHADAVKAIELADVVVFVTIPAKFAYLDLERTVKLVRDMEKPVAGVFLNFTHVKCECGRTIELFNDSYSPALMDLPIVQEIPFGEIRINLDRLLHHLSNPITLKRHTVSSIAKRKLVKAVLRGIAKMG